MNNQTYRFRQEAKLLLNLEVVIELDGEPIGTIQEDCVISLNDKEGNELYVIERKKNGWIVIEYFIQDNGRDAPPDTGERVIIDGIDIDDAIHYIKHKQCDDEIKAARQSIGEDVQCALMNAPSMDDMVEFVKRVVKLELGKGYLNPLKADGEQLLKNHEPAESICH